jgi:hypothetical protein
VIRVDFSAILSNLISTHAKFSDSDFLPAARAGTLPGYRPPALPALEGRDGGG